MPDSTTLPDGRDARPGFGFYPDDEAGRRRWSLSVATACKALGGLSSDDPRAIFYAHVLFQSDLPTSDPSAGEDPGEPSVFDEVDFDEALDGLNLVDWTEWLHPRMHGRFARKYGTEIAKRNEEHQLSAGALKRQGRNAEAQARRIANRTRASGGGTGDPIAILDDVTAENVRKTIQSLPPAVRAKIEKWPPDHPLVGSAAHRALNGYHDTRTRYVESRGRNGEVTYSAERAALHASIMSHYIEKALADGAASDEPEAHFTAGGPAAGKTSLRKIDRSIPPTLNVDPDDIKQHLPEYQMMLHPDWGPEEVGAELEAIANGNDPTPPSMNAGETPDPYAAYGVHHESSDIGRALVEYAYAHGLNVTIDGTGNTDPGWFAEQVAHAQKRGHKAHVHYSFAPVDEALARSVLRAQHDGRWLSPGFVVDTHTKVAQRFVEEIQHMPDVGVSVWDTSGNGKTPTLIGHAEPHPEGAYGNWQTADERLNHFYQAADGIYHQGHMGFAEDPATGPVDPTAAAAPAAPAVGPDGAPLPADASAAPAAPGAPPAGPPGASADPAATDPTMQQPPAPTPTTMPFDGFYADRSPDSAEYLNTSHQWRPGATYELPAMGGKPATKLQLPEARPDLRP